MNGILLIDKPAGWTSNDAVQKLRGLLHERRIGHAGTLDPMATGLLTVFVGRATRAVEFAEHDDKRYLARLRLGVTTDTQDITGSVLREVPVTVHDIPPTLSRPQGDRPGPMEKEAMTIRFRTLEETVASFRGEQEQVPPMYSAVKVDGRRLYQLARQGKTVERAPRPITVREIAFSGRDGEDWLLDIRCSKGTYVRTLCHDIGEALGCGACMSGLRRLEAGAFSVEDAFTLEDVAAGRYRLLPTDTLFAARRAVTVSPAGERKLRNGQSCDLRILAENEKAPPADGEELRIYSASGEFLALCRAENGRLNLIKSFYEV